MNRRFLDRLRYPYLQTSLPENILPGRDLNKKGTKGGYKPGSRFLRRGSQSSRGFLLRSRRGRLSVYTKMMSGSGTAALRGQGISPTRLDTLETGSMLSVVAQTRVWANKPQTPVRCGWRSHPSDTQMEPAQLNDRLARSYKETPDETSPRPLQGGKLMKQSNLQSPRARGRFYQSISQLEGGISKRHEKRVSQVSLRLSEKRKLRILYGGLSNREIGNLIKRGLKERGQFCDNLFKLLESRLEVVLWRIGFFSTIPAARNWVRCGRVAVNSKVLTVANHLLQPGDVVTIPPQFTNSLCQSIRQTYDVFQNVDSFQTSHQLSTPLTPSPMRSKTAQEATPYQDRPSPSTYNELIGAPLSFLRGLREGSPLLKRGQRRRGIWLPIRLSNVEVSYLSLIAIYLYPPQRAFLPAPVDIETIQRR